MAEGFVVPFAGGITALFGVRRSSQASLRWLGFEEYALSTFRSTAGLPGGTLEGLLSGFPAESCAMLVARSEQAH